MFRYPQLDCFNALLLKLYKQEIIDIVVAYERYRLAILAEVERRDKAQLLADSIKQQQQQQQRERVHYPSPHLTSAITPSDQLLSERF